MLIFFLSFPILNPKIKCVRSAPLTGIQKSNLVASSNLDCLARGAVEVLQRDQRAAGNLRGGR